MSDGPFIQQRGERPPRRTRPAISTDTPLRLDPSMTNHWNRWSPFVVLPVLLVVGANIATIDFGFLLFVAMCGFVAWIVAHMPWHVELREQRIAWRAWIGSGERDVAGLTRIRRQRTNNGDTITLEFDDGARLVLLGSWKTFHDRFLDRLQRIAPRVEVQRAGWGNAVVYGYRPPRSGAR